MAKTHSNGYLTPSQLAEQWHVSLRTVQRWLADGRIKSTRMPGGRYRIRPEDAAAAITEISA